MSSNFCSRLLFEGFVIGVVVLDINIAVVVVVSYLTGEQPVPLSTKTMRQVVTPN